MKTPTGVSSERQAYQPGHWITMTGYALDATDLRVGVTKCAEARPMTRAVSKTDAILKEVMKP